VPVTHSRSSRLLPDESALRNRLLLALPRTDYQRIAEHLRMKTVGVGVTLQDQTTRISDVYFPNGGVFSVTSRMRDGALVEVATVGREGMLGVGVFLGDPLGAGRTFQQVPNGALPALAAGRFKEETARPGRFREIIGLYEQANILQVMQCTACNALHDARQRCSRWLLQTHDRVDGDDFSLKHEFLAAMLGVRRPTVTVVLRTLQEAGLIASRYGRIRILNRKRLEAASCECYAVIQEHFVRLGLLPSDLEVNLAV
jgi:CRP-like cAMP-binding protein